MSKSKSPKNPIQKAIEDSFVELNKGGTKLKDFMMEIDQRDNADLSKYQTYKHLTDDKEPKTYTGTVKKKITDSVSNETITKEEQGQVKYTPWMNLTTDVNIVLTKFFESYKSDIQAIFNSTSGISTMQDQLSAIINYGGLSNYNIAKFVAAWSRFSQIPDDSISDSLITALGKIHDEQNSSQSFYRSSTRYLAKFLMSLFNLVSAKLYSARSLISADMVYGIFFQFETIMKMARNDNKFIMNMTFYTECESVINAKKKENADKREANKKKDGSEEKTTTTTTKKSTRKTTSTSKEEDKNTSNNTPYNGGDFAAEDDDNDLH